MEKIFAYKDTVSAVTGILGGTLLAIFGEWTMALTALMVFMIVDYCTGLMVGFAGKSTKTDSGGLRSSAGLAGLTKKAVMILIVVTMHFVDMALGLDYFRDIVVIGFCANELLSIVENAGLLGVGLPKGVTKAIDVLKDKSEDKESD